MSVTNINKADMNQQPNDKQTICIVIPCYNEEEVLPWAMGKLQTMIGKMKAETGIEGRLLLVDDGSRDRTWELIEGFAAEHSNVAGVKLSHNEGHQNALWAGMQESLGMCDAIVSIDADLQDDEMAIIDMHASLPRARTSSTVCASSARPTHGSRDLQRRHSTVLCRQPTRR